LEVSLLHDQEATALKWGNDKTATSATSSLILYTQKGLPNREIYVEVRPCGFGLSSSAFLATVFSVPRAFPAFTTKEKAVVRKGLAQGMLPSQNPLSRACSPVCHILGENFQYIWTTHFLYIKTIQIFVSVTRGHITHQNFSSSFKFYQL